MSIKIYSAFRIKDGVDVWPLLWKIRDQATENAKRALRNHYIDLVFHTDSSTKEYWIEFGDRTKHAFDALTGRAKQELHFRLDRAHKQVKSRFKDNVTSSVREEYNLEVNLAIYPHTSGNYLRTFCDSASIMRDVLDFVEELPELEDYYFQNSSDGPKDIPEEQWQARRAVWEEIYQSTNNHGFANHALIEVVSWTRLIFVDPWVELAQEWMANPPELPSYEEVWAARLRKLSSFTSVVAQHHLIRAQPGNVTIVKHRHRWLSIIGDTVKHHDTLNQAGDHVHFEHLPERERQWILGMIERHKNREAT